jgi:hypothetical protein
MKKVLKKVADFFSNLPPKTLKALRNVDNQRKLFQLLLGIIIAVSIVLIFVGIVNLVTMGFMSLVDLVVRNAQKIFVATLLVGFVEYVVYSIIKWFRKTKAEPIQQYIEDPSLAQRNAILVSQNIVKRGLHRTLSALNASGLGLICQPNPDEIVSPEPDMTKAPIVFPFLIQKGVDIIDEVAIKTALNTQMNTLAMQGLLENVPRDMFQYEGLYYQRMYVDSVINLVNSLYVAINIVITDNIYAEFIRNQNRYPQAFSGANTYDRHF